jgi:predicted RNase H-like HicB family nuclease
MSQNKGVKNMAFNPDINTKITLDGIYLDIFKQALQGYCQNGCSPEEATENAFGVVRVLFKKTFNEEDNTLSIDFFSEFQKIEHISGKRIPENKLYDVKNALTNGVTAENILSKNPNLFDSK